MAASIAAVKLKEINAARTQIVIESISAMVQHKWSEKAMRQMREKGEGRKTRTREPRNPEEEARNATYFDENGKYCIPLLAVKSAIISAAHKDIGIEKTLVRKALFIKGDSQMMIPIKCEKPTVREDCVTVGMGSADLRYRPQFDKWEATLDIEFDADLLQAQDIINLIDRAGFGIGICEMRPEKGKDLGRFRVKR